MTVHNSLKTTAKKQEEVKRLRFPLVSSHAKFNHNIAVQASRNQCLKGSLMSKKKLAPLTEYIPVRLSKKESEALTAYCAETGITKSEYFRSVLRIHFGFQDDLLALRLIEPNPKKPI